VALFETTFPPYHPFGSRLLRLQTPMLSGTDVAVLQAVYNLMLKTMNPPLGPMGSPITLNGTFDAATQQAVRNIESYFGLTVDGVAGENVYFVYGQGVGSRTTYGGPVYGSRQLSTGSVGGDVTILQNRLNCFRYSRLTGGPASGTFGNNTAAAVFAFKSDAVANGQTGLTSNSVVGDGTFDATWLYTFAGGRAIQTGRNGFDVVFVQVLLKQLGYYTGAITGYYDAATVAAVRAFQSAEGIGTDGVIGPVTFYHLGLHNQNPAPNPLGLAWPAAPPPAEVTTCASPLSASSSLVDVSYGSATLVSAPTPGYQSINVVVDNLASPSIFGSQYTGYSFTLTNPSTGLPVLTVPLETLTSGVDVYAASAFTDLTTPYPRGAVNVYPTPGGGTFAPLALTGDLADCT